MALATGAPVKDAAGDGCGAAGEGRLRSCGLLRRACARVRRAKRRGAFDARLRRLAGCPGAAAYAVSPGFSKQCRRMLFEWRSSSSFDSGESSSSHHRKIWIMPPA